MIEETNHIARPWYKEFWAWFVFTPLIVVIIACSFTVTMAFKYKDAVVKDDYYKVGKMINAEFKPAKEAQRLGLEAQLFFDAQTQLISLSLNETEWVADETLLLSLSHPFNEDQDYFITLKQTDSLMWKAKLPEFGEGRWYLKLAAINDYGEEYWYLQDEITLPASEPFNLP